MKKRTLSSAFNVIINFVIFFAVAIISFILSALIISPSLLYAQFFYAGLSCFIFGAFFCIMAYVFKLHATLWTHISYTDYLKFITSAVIADIITFVVRYSIGFSNAGYEFYVILGLVSSILYVGFCIIKGILHEHNEATSYAKTDIEPVLHGNVMIIGAGNAGYQLINEINNIKKSRNYKVKCFIDDDPSKAGMYSAGVPIVGGRDMILRAVKEYAISTILFAIPSCPADDKATIMKICQQTKCKLRTIPSILQFATDEIEVNLSQIREVNVEDLLGRESIKLNNDSVFGYIKDRIVLVTGGGGSIGSELCRQIAAHNPKQLIIFDVYENNAYDIQNELIRTYPGLNLLALIGSVRDSKRLECIFSKYHPEIVFHAAAHKHVPLMEVSPNETLKNNVFGTYKTAKCADKYGVKKFVLISTDKAVNPTNIMGASKRICEMVIQYMNAHSETDYAAVRFGNVLGSNGSVIPLFKKQIAAGGPVTVTDPNIIRYFMTIPEAVSLVLQAGANAKGGEIFVLDMGKPVKILDLAENLIRLSGLEPYVDIKIEFTGLRPGEKLYEELLMSEEGLTKTDNKLIYIGKPIDFDYDLLETTLNEMQQIMYDDSADVRVLVKRLVTTYHYNE